MQIWHAEIKELETLYTSVKGRFSELEKELERLIKADYEFLDNNIDAFYTEEHRFSILFQILTGLLLVTGCLGLYGLVSFIINKKMKELAVRKVMGASASNILILLSKNYFKLVFIAFVVASPLVYYFMSDWLSQFAYHVDLKWWYFILPGILILATAFLTVSGKTYRAARCNPAEILKYE